MSLILDKKSLEPHIDYLAKDYSSFRKLMLDRLALSIPEWQSDNPADVGVLLMEILAYSADQVSYFQDAVATEAYLTTARQRISVRRHARLLDYRMHEGCNARTWIQIQVNDDLELNDNVSFMTKQLGQPVVLDDSQEHYSGENFISMHKAQLYEAHNEMRFYVQGEKKGFLKEGSVLATLYSQKNLKIGDVLVLSALDLVHPVRLIKVIHEGEKTHIEWHSLDALPFDMPLDDSTVALGNIVLADHGRWVNGEELHFQESDNISVDQIRLEYINLVHAVPFDLQLESKRSACESIMQNPVKAIPIIELTEEMRGTDAFSKGTGRWQSQLDLLHSDRDSRDFVVEVNNDRCAVLRFGGGEVGKLPDQNSNFYVNYRIGVPTRGNIGARSIHHIFADTPSFHEILKEKVKSVSNPLAALGGTSPEAIDNVKRNAPKMFRHQQRCVTVRDYVERVSKHPEIKRAEADIRWTGSWETIFIAVERNDLQPVDERFKNKLRAYLKQYELLGHDLEIVGPYLVPLDIVFVVYKDFNYNKVTLLHELNESLSSRVSIEGVKGYFHSDNFGFGEDLFLSKLVTHIMGLPGVRGLDLKDPRTKFQRINNRMSNTLEVGRVDIGPLEMLQLKNDFSNPQYGRLELIIEDE